VEEGERVFIRPQGFEGMSVFNHHRPFSLVDSFLPRSLTHILENAVGSSDLLAICGSRFGGGCEFEDCWRGGFRRVTGG
jgi:hypothetical protein